MGPGGPFGNLCCPCGKLRGLSERTFRPLMGSKPCCGGGDRGMAASPGLPYGSSAVVSPTVIAPTVGGVTTTVPSSPAGTITAPTDSIPSQLEPIPSATPGAAPSNGDATPSQGAKANTGKANYEAYRSNTGNASASTLSTSPVPTTRSAQGSAVSPDGNDAIDNLPPLDLPTDAAPVATSTPPAPAAPEIEAKPAVKTVEQPKPAAGIKHFAGVDAKISAGGLPEAAGLKWLADKGYKTLLDLREESEVTAAFRAEVKGLGLRYVSLPMNVKTLDAEHVRRFEQELSLADSRPIYFFDADGTRAGALWYIHRVAVDHVDAKAARRDAEEIGLTDPAFLRAADAYLSQPSAPKPAPASDLPQPALPSDAGIERSRSPFRGSLADPFGQRGLEDEDAFSRRPNEPNRAWAATGYRIVKERPRHTIPSSTSSGESIRSSCRDARIFSFSRIGRDSPIW